MPDTCLLPAFTQTEELTIERDPTESSVWLIRHRGLRLVVGTAPWPKVRLLLAREEFRHPSCYAILGDTCLRPGMQGIPGTHVGRTGCPPARARQHRQSPPLSSMRRLVVITADDRNGLLLDEAAALERLLHIEALSAGSHRVVSRLPRDRGLTPGVFTRVTHWLDGLRWMLAVAGCPILEPAYAMPQQAPVDDAPAAPEPVAAPPAVGWTATLPQGLLARPDAHRFRLDHHEISATALVVDGWCVVRRGSRARVGEIDSIQEGLRAKRQHLLTAGILQPVPGRDDLWEAVCDFGLPSLTNAARTLLGSNARARLWRRLP